MELKVRVAMETVPGCQHETSLEHALCGNGWLLQAYCRTFQGQVPVCRSSVIHQSNARKDSCDYGGVERIWAADDGGVGTGWVPSCCDDARSCTARKTRRSNCRKWCGWKHRRARIG